ncbi:cytochrome P450 4C1-like [Papilio machaon]|uniref:cytochrome P450 4C1-like n=1 Tax=Papilio machaon TaxID=76193 RepID=UPI001E665AB5|nr:cytochrome P450 4C1-like [Papilio machaon]
MSNRLDVNKFHPVFLHRGLTMLVILTLFILLIIFIVYKDGKTKDIRKIPGEKAWPIIGNSHYLLVPLDHLFTYLRKLRKQYGDIFQIHAVNMQTINISNPKHVEIILSGTRFIDKQIPYTFLRPWLREGLLVSNGKKWHQRRKILTQAFHFNILKKYLRTFTEQTEKLMEKVDIEAKKVQCDVLPLITNATLKIMCETAMGGANEEYMQSICDKYLKAINEIGKSITQRFCRIWLYADIVFDYSKIGRIQKKAISDLHHFTMNIIRDRKDSHSNNIMLDTDNGAIYGRKGGLAMLDLLLENEKDGVIDFEGIREEVDTFMFEGHDTTASALSFMIMRIANEPNIQKSIYEELNSIFGESERLATIEDLNNMKYLECCIKESLRLYPSVPFISRYLAEEVKLGNYKIPADTLCQIHVYDMHHDEHLYPEPETFIPERFLPENANKRHPYAYIPFSAGPRNCIGQKFAMMEMKTVMSTLLRHFYIESVTKHEDVKFTCDLILRCTHPLYVRFCRR